MGGEGDCLFIVGGAYLKADPPGLTCVITNGLLRWGWSGITPPLNVIPKDPSIRSSVISAIFVVTHSEFCDAVYKKN